MIRSFSIVIAAGETGELTAPDGLKFKRFIIRNVNATYWFDDENRIINYFYAPYNDYIYIDVSGSEMIKTIHVHNQSTSDASFSLFVEEYGHEQ